MFGAQDHNSFKRINTGGTASLLSYISGNTLTTSAAFCNVIEESVDAKITGCQDLLVTFSGILLTGITVGIKEVFQE